MFKNKSLQSILSTFIKPVEELQVLQDQNNKEIVEKNDKIAALTVDCEDLKDETARAAKVQQKIKELME